MIENALVEEMKNLRYSLHQAPEVAHQETGTAAQIATYLQKHNPDELHTGLGGNGIVALYQGAEPGPRLFFRCELDALPITERNDLPYRSQREGFGHQCGHDGHMAMVAALGAILGKKPLRRGSVGLLFQPAEETGEGAQKLLSDPRFTALQPDMLFALHNLPGYPTGTVIIPQGLFASASVGLKVTLHGAPSHASHPEGGRNPALAAAHMIQALMAIPGQYTAFGQAALITPVHVQVGQPAFGTSPGKGELGFTLRCHRNAELALLQERCEIFIDALAKAYDLRFTWHYVESFATVENDPELRAQVVELAREGGYSILEPEDPFSWSEDFGLLTGAYRGAMFGLGAGEKHPQLHNENYNFPDELLPVGLDMYHRLVQYYLGDNS